eukprot:UN22476
MLWIQYYSSVFIRDELTNSSPSSLKCFFHFSASAEFPYIHFNGDDSFHLKLHSIPFCIQFSCLFNLMFQSVHASISCIISSKHTQNCKFKELPNTFGQILKVYFLNRTRGDWKLIMHQ